jgi:hypothetical protein
LTLQLQQGYTNLLEVCNFQLDEVVEDFELNVLVIDLNENWNIITKWKA